MICVGNKGDDKVNVGQLRIERSAVIHIEGNGSCVLDALAKLLSALKCAARCLPIKLN